MISNKKIGIVVVGYGYWSPKLIRNIQKFDELDIVAICEKDESRHQAIREAFPDLKLTRHYREAYQYPEVDAAVIGTIISSHYRIAKSALEHGKHVLIEKPMATTEKECHDLLKLGQEKNLIIMVDHTYVYSSAIQGLKQIIDKGELGEIYIFDSVRTNLGLFQRDTNVIWDLAPHDFSIFNYVMNKKPTHISAYGRKTAVHSSQGEGYDSIVYINIFKEKELIGHIHISWLAPLKIRQIMVVGSKQMAVYDQLDKEGQLKVYSKSVKINEGEGKMFDHIEGNVKIPVISKQEDLESMIKDFKDSLISGKPPTSHGEFGLQVVKMLVAANKSLKKRGKRVKI